MNGDLPPEPPMVGTLREIANAEGGPMFHGWPDRWWDAYLRRCPNDHVSSMTLSTERGDVCLAAGCRADVYLTFPEDRDGPLAARGPVPLGDDPQEEK